MSLSTSAKVVKDLETAALTLDIINENGDLCRDGIRATNFLQLIANHLIAEIEKEGDIGEIADNLHKSYVQIAKQAP